MVHLSSKKLHADTLKKLHNQFADSLGKRGGVDTSAFFEELFGREERIQFAKRLAAVYMLSEGLSAYRIAQVLGLSTSTVNKMRVTYDKNGFNTIIAHYQNKNNHARFWKTLEVLLRLGMPPHGKGRWKLFHELTDKKR